MQNRASSLKPWIAAIWLAWLGPACVEFEPQDSGANAGPGSGSPETSNATSDDVPTTTGSDGICSVWRQDCPVDYKCVPTDGTGEGFYNTTTCVPIVDPPQGLGEACMVLGTLASGRDTCDLGLLCWNLDPEGTGECVPLCSGSAAQPICPVDQVCDITNGGVLPLCVHACHPLMADCAPNQVCLPGSDGFICDADASGTLGNYGDPCAFVNACKPGLLCAAGAAVPGCESEACCTAYCDASLPEAPCPDASQACVPYYAPGTAPAGYEDVGLCSQ